MDSKDSVFIHTDSSVIEVKFSKLPDNFDADEVLRIDYANIYGEKVTISTLVNKLGLLVELASFQKKSKDLEFKIYDAEKRKELRRQAVDNGGKFQVGEEWVKMTKDSLDEAMVLDKGWQVKQKNVYKAEKDLGVITSLFWSAKDKSDHLKHLLHPISPEEFQSELVEGELNGIIIKKHKKKY